MPEQNNLPVPVEETRQYIRVTPTDEPIDPDTATAQFERLHTLKSRNTDTALLSRFTNSPPTIDIYLVAPPEDTQTIQYYVGVDAEDLHQPLERILRTLFPDSYEFRTVQWAPTLLPAQPAAGVEFDGRPDRRKDWQTRLTPLQEFQNESKHVRTPLASVVEAMAATEGPALLQILVRPRADWSTDRDLHRRELEEGRESWLGQLIATLITTPEPTHTDTPVPVEDRARLDELADRDPRHSFDVNIRAILSNDTDQHVADDLATAFAEVSHTTYELTGTVYTDTDAADLRTRVCDRTFQPADYDRLKNRLPLTTPTSPGIVVDASELGSLCLLDGSALTTAARRALATTPGERRMLPPPPASHLNPFRDDGLPLGRPLSQDGTAQENPVTLPPSLQSLHVAWFGKTGSGKSTSLTNGIVANHAATDGADIVFLPKGGGMATEYMRAHYATYGSLDSVLYFDCAALLPALSFFDIRKDLAAGVSRTTAVEDKADHYLELLVGIMGRDRFEQAVRSPDIIRYLVKALFDPVNGDDAFQHRALHAAAQEMHDRQSAPAVADEDLERLLAGVVANSARSFDEIMQGVANRIEKIPVDRRLARLFNHVPEGDGPHFDFGDFLDEDVVIIVDTGRIRTDTQRVMTLVLLSNLWSALRRRAQSTPSTESYKLVNVYLEEAASVATSNILQDLLSQSRGFGVGITLAMQFPDQLRRIDDAVYRELLNNVSTYVTGNVPTDDRLADRFTTADMSEQEMSDQLKWLPRGEWLVQLPAPFDHPEPRPFQVRSLPLPAGDPDGPGQPIPTDEMEPLIADVTARTRSEAGLTLASPSTPGETDDGSDPAGESRPMRVDSALPQTRRLPETVSYDRESHALHCQDCGNRYDPSIDGMRRAIACCGAIADVDPDDVPICTLNLKRSAEERANSEWSTTQLCFLQAVYNAQQLRYDPLEYDLLSDSMLRLQEYVGIESDAVQDLCDADVLRHDTDRPHRLYSVTPAGRDAIGESYRRGVDYGHECGDLEESSEHVLAVEAARLYLEHEYAADTESTVTQVIPYYEIQDGSLPAATFMGTDEDAVEEVSESYSLHRLDLVGLDAEGEIRITLEAERVNNDHRRAVPADFDKMAACDPDEAIWVAMSHDAAHEVLAALNDPLEGEPRVEKTYSESTPASSFTIDEPGFSDIITVNQLLDRINRPDPRDLQG